MKKVFKIVGIKLMMIILIALIFFIVDYNRVQKQKKPIFCIKNLAGTIMDGGTVEYFGLGYKVIDFNRLSGYSEIKIGTWLMKYGDFREEYELKEKEINYNNEIQSDTNIPTFIVNFDGLKNIPAIEKFIKNTTYYSSNRISDEVRIITYTTEGDKIITDLKYINSDNKENELVGTYIITIDNTKDKFANEGDRETNITEYSGTIYSIVKETQNDSIVIKLKVNELIETTIKYEDIVICSYPDTLVESPSFYASIIESNQEYILVEPYKNESIRQSSDNIVVLLGKDNDMIFENGTHVKITYTGYILETYPAQIYPIDIEIKSTDDFEVLFEQRKDLEVIDIINKNEISTYSYNIKSYGGNVYIIINGQKLKLGEALLDNKITMTEIIEKANSDVENGKIESDIYKDGGSIIYFYDYYNMIKCYTLDGNRDVYIGNTSMSLNDVD